MSNDAQRIVIAGGGAAGFFAAIACAEAARKNEVVLLEKSAHFLSKVRISGGGRCNVTHACFDARELAKRYPRGGRALIAPFQKFQPRDTMAWFENRGVKLKIESDGRVFPITDSSRTIIECLTRAAAEAGVKTFLQRGIERVEKNPEGIFLLTLGDGSTLACGKLLLATGGPRGQSVAEIARALGHTIEPPVPSLFTFHIESPWLRELSGVTIEDAELSIPATKLRERGAILITHWGLSGPATLRMSAWGARELHAQGYHFPLRVDWLPGWAAEEISAEFQSRRTTQPTRFIINSPLAPLPARLWEKIVVESGIAHATQWTRLARGDAQKLVEKIKRTELQVDGKSLNKDEFVTCGGVSLREVDFKTMQSRVCPGLFFAGELLDIDGITGGFNFQAAWTTGWLAGRAMAGDE